MPADRVRRARASGSTWTPTRSRRRPASTSARSASRRAATSGQETVARLHYKGKPNRHLRGLRLRAPAERGDEILLGDKVVGTVGSACVSPRLGPIALALVRREAGPGDEVLVAGGAATVAELPFSGD